MLKLNNIYNMDVWEGLKLLDDESIDCCITSPPYWSLRDYGIPPSVWGGDPECVHEFEMETKKAISEEPTRWQHQGKVGVNLDLEKHEKVTKAKEHIIMNGFCNKCGAWQGTLGLEPNFEMFINNLCDIYDDVKRVLKKSGTCWVNLGDSYASNKTECTWDTFGNYRYDGGKGKRKVGYIKQKRDFGIIQQKCLMLLPQRFAIEMVNRGWILRNVIVWHKPNAMPSSARDRFTVDFEYVYFFVKAKKYWFEQQREKLSNSKANRERRKYKTGASNGKITNAADDNVAPNACFQKFHQPESLGKNKRTVWRIPTKPNPEAHFATFPPKLVEPMIKSGCPEFICKVCGKPREKIMKNTKEYDKIKEKWNHINMGGNIKKGRNRKTGYPGHITKQEIFEGFTDCGCGSDYTPGVVLDIFAGTGTTLKKAWELGRNYLGFEISKEYTEIANRILKSTKNSRLDKFF